jgi:hypothetical protein
MPLMAIMAITQDGGGTSIEDVTCYSCGGKGHYAGNEDCTKPGTERAEAKAKVGAKAKTNPIAQA